MSMIQFIKLSGNCFYINADKSHITDFNEKNVKHFDKSEISDFSIFTQEGTQIQRVKFDVTESQEFAGGTVLGFLYENGKFSGKFHTNVDKTINESWTGKFLLEDETIYIHGEIYINNELSLDFFIKIGESSGKLFDVKTNVSSEKGLVADYFFHKKLLKLAATYKSQSNVISYYPKAISLKLKPTTENDVYIAMCIAYSWMPTMLDIYTNGEKSLNDYVPIVQRFSKIKTLNAINKNEKTISDDLVKLAKLVNNSIVGASKMLHLFYPKTVPIIDSRVLIGWNQFFKFEYSNKPKLKIPDSFPGKIESQVELYIKYWKLLMEWTETVSGSTIREIEEALYWVGKNNNK